ncbi:hypothetical protein ACHAWF_007732 [Thalassiosira exigua]
MAYPQAPIEYDLYMEHPRGISAKGARAKDYALKLLGNVYGQKQGGRVCGTSISRPSSSMSWDSLSRRSINASSIKDLQSLSATLMMALRWTSTARTWTTSFRSSWMPSSKSKTWVIPTTMWASTSSANLMEPSTSSRLHSLTRSLLTAD